MYKVVKVFSKIFHFNFMNANFRFFHSDKRKSRASAQGQGLFAPCGKIFLNLLIIAL